MAHSVESPSETINGDRLWTLRWRLWLASMYHRKHARFLDGVDRAANAIGTLAGASAFASILAANPTAGLWASALVAVVSTCALVYSPAAAARTHSELARDFKKLEADVEEVGEEMTKAELRKFEAMRLRLEMVEPPQLGALVTHCHNELCIARGIDSVTKLPWHQSAFMHLYNFDQSGDSVVVDPA